MRTMVIVLVAALAGCSDATPGSTEQPGTAASAMPFAHNITFVDTAVLVETFTGTFEFTDSPVVQQGPGILGLATSGVHIIDISHLIGPGHNFVTAKTASGDVALGIQPGDFGDIWTFDCGSCDGSKLEANVVSKNGALSLSVSYQGWAPADISTHAAGIEYNVEVTVERLADRIPTGIAIEVDMVAGSGVVLTGQGGAVPDVLVYGPDDAFMGKLAGGDQVEMTLQENGTPGAYVFLPVGHGSFYSLQAVRSDGIESPPAARILEQRIEFVPPQVFPDGLAHDVTWTVDAAMTPIQVGVCMFGNGVIMSGTVSMVGPDGVELGSGAVPGLSLLSYGACTFTEMGDDRLEPGTYTFHYVDQAAVATGVQEYMIYYGR